MTGRAGVLRFEDVRVRYGRREVLRVEDLGLESGRTLAVLGPNGSGKSTLLQVGALLREPTAGSVSLFGEQPRRRNRVRLRRRTATVLADPTLLDMSVRANIETALRIHGVPRDERRARADAWLDRLGVLSLAEARPHTLSAGEAQRVSLARAFAVEPELLFLDEPFSSLDIDTRLRLTGELRELLPSHGIAALLATHDRSEAALLAQDAVVLIEGCIEQSGHVQTLLEQPRTRAAAQFLGFTVLEGPTAERALREPLSGAVALPPDAVALATGDAPGAVAAEVRAVRGGSGRVEVVVDLGALVAVACDLNDIAGMRIQVGDLVQVQVQRERAVTLEA